MLTLQPQTKSKERKLESGRKGAGFDPSTDQSCQEVEQLFALLVTIAQNPFLTTRLLNQSTIGLTPKL